MYEIELDDFEIGQIALSGQCFRINKEGGDCWSVFAFNRCLKIQQLGRLCRFDCSDEEFKIWRNYFDLNTDYSKIKAMVYKSADQYLIDAVNFGYGIRILKQDLWEVIVSYIISQRNNIVRIKHTIEKLCIPFGGNFPTANDLENYSEADFVKLGLGYRVKYLYNMVQFVSTGGNIDILREMSYDSAIKYLKQFNGIGDKIANCIALFGLYKTEAFPIDVWIQRIIDKYYNGHFDFRRYKKYAGIIQQYMFFYERNRDRKMDCVNAVITAPD